MIRAHKPLPDWQVRRWFNSDHDLELADLRGRVVLIHAFQMFCPGCLQQAIPEAERIHRALTGPDFFVVGLHTVFEKDLVWNQTAPGAGPSGNGASQRISSNIPMWASRASEPIFGRCRDAGFKGGLNCASDVSQGSAPGDGYFHSARTTRYAAFWGKGVEPA